MKKSDSKKSNKSISFSEEPKKAVSPDINFRLESYRNRFFELKGRYPDQNEIPEILGGTLIGSLK